MSIVKGFFGVDTHCFFVEADLRGIVSRNHLYLDLYVSVGFVIEIYSGARSRLFVCEEEVIEIYSFVCGGEECRSGSAIDGEMDICLFFGERRLVSGICGEAWVLGLSGSRPVPCGGVGFDQRDICEMSELVGRQISGSRLSCGKSVRVPLFMQYEL